MRAGYIDALEAVAFLAKNVAAVQPELGLVNDDILQLLDGKTLGIEIKPDEIGAFSVNEPYLWQMLCQIFFSKLDIFFNIG